MPRDTIVCTGQHKCPNAQPILRESLDESIVELELQGLSDLDREI